MSIQRFALVLFGLMLSSGLIASSAAAQPNPAAEPDAQVQHLTCLKDTQGLMCTVTDTSVPNASTVMGANPAPNASEIPASTWLTGEQLGQLSTGLLGIMFLGLPISLAFAVLLYDKRDAKRTQMIAWLEQIWKQSPQH